MFGAEMGQFPVATDEIKAHECNNPASRNAVFCGVLSSAEFFDHTWSPHSPRDIRRTSGDRPS